MALSKQQIASFWQRVEKTPDCWLWVGHVSKNGYGKFSTSNLGTLSAHRISAVIAGKMEKVRKEELGAKGQVVMHTCDNRRCVNPNHLLVGTQKQNMADAKTKGRKWFGEYSGEQNGRAKLNAVQVNKIRSLIGKLPYREIAQMFNINFSQVSSIKTGKTWGSV